MSITDIISASLSLFGGIGVFLVACKLMSSNIESASGPGLRKLFFRIYENKLLGVGIGTAVTALVQSSGAVTVMAMGFLNASVINLYQAATIIFGANIGTTVTGQIVALGMSGSNAISTSVLFSGLAGIGAFIMSFGKKDNVKKAGGIITGFGMLFIGLSMMSSSMRNFAELESVKELMAYICNPINIVVLGVILTAIVQSSSVITSIAITMVVSGLFTLDQGIYITIGSNIGACVVGVLAGMTGSSNAKRASLIGIMFNIAGAFVFMIIEYALKLTVNVKYSDMMIALFPKAPQVQLAMFHTFYNIIKVVVFLPFTGIFVNLSTKIIKEKENAKKGLHTYFIDNSILETPSIAAGALKGEVLNMSMIEMENFNLAVDMICNNNSKEIDNFMERKKELTFLSHEIAKYAIALLKFQHTDYDRKYISSTFRTVTDLERIGDYCERITDHEKSLLEGNDILPSSAISEISKLKDVINQMASFVYTAYRNIDEDAFKKAFELEEFVDDFTDKMTTNHMTNINVNTHTANAGAVYLSLAENIEAIADHLISIGKTVFLLNGFDKATTQDL